MELKFEMPKEMSSIIKVIGIGGGGGNAVNHMYRQGINGVDFIVCNTDAQALEMSPIPNKVQLGTSLTEGMGAGSIPEVGRNSAIENIENIREMLGSNTRMLFITAGMGGGTGTGASPIIAKIAKELEILTVAIVTTPFSFEGKRRKMQAEDGLGELKKYVDSYLVISNDRLREIFGNLTLGSAFAQADDILTTAAKGIAEIITVPGLINVDFKDVRTVMNNSGVAIMGSCAAEGEDRALKAVEGALASPLLKDNEIEGARYILLNISSSAAQEVTMDELSIITDYIQEQAGLSADLIWGHCVDENLGAKVSVTIIATGFQTKEERVQQKSEEKVFVNLDEEKTENKNTSRIQNIVETQDNEIPHIVVTPRAKLNNIKQVSNQPSLFQNEAIIETTEEKVFFNLEDEKPIQEEPNQDLRIVYAESEIEPTKTPEAEPTTLAEPIVEIEEQPVVATIPPPVVEEAPKTLSVEEIKLRRMKLDERLKSINQGDTNQLRSSNSDDLIRLENEPAYLRRKNAAPSEVPHSSESTLSRFSIIQNPDGKSEIRTNNSFLHDNVD